MRLTVETVARADTMAIEAYLLFEDMNDAKLSELNLLQRAETDPLTGLLNRVTFEQRVNQSIRESGAHTQHALLMLDIDNFKQINDVFGHDTGDRALIVLANALRSAPRSGDVVSRLGGDEYMVFLCGIADEPAAIAKAKQIRALVHTSFREENRITVRIGIAFSPRDGADFRRYIKKLTMRSIKSKVPQRTARRFTASGIRMSSGCRRPRCRAYHAISPERQPPATACESDCGNGDAKSAPTWLRRADRTSDSAG